MDLCFELCCYLKQQCGSNVIVAYFLERNQAVSRRRWRNILVSESGTDIKVRKGSGGGKATEPPPGPIIEHRPSVVEPPTKASGSNPGAFAFVGQAVTIYSAHDHPLSA